MQPVYALCLYGACAFGITPPDNSILIPVNNPRDHVFDVQRNLVYISRTNTNLVERFDLSTRTFLTPMQLGMTGFFSQAIDITPSGEYLYAATSTGSGNTTYVGKFNLTTGIDEGFSFSATALSPDSRDLTITSRGTAFISSGNVGYLTEIDLATDSVRDRTDAPGSFGGRVRDRSGLFPSADRNTVFIWEGNISTGPGFVYDAANDAFLSPRNLGYSWVAGASVNRDGSLIATPRSNQNLLIRDRSLNVIHDVGLPYSGAHFDRVRDVLYALEEATDEIIALNTNTWTELYRFPVGESINDSRYFQEGHMTVSPDGSFLLMSTDSGVRVYPIPEPATAALLITGGIVVLLCRRKMAV